GQLHGSVLRRERFEIVAGGPQLETTLHREIARGARRKAWMRIHSRPHCRAAERESLQARAALHDARTRVIYLRMPAANLLTDSQRHRVHKMREAGLDDVANIADAKPDHRYEICK